MSTPATHSDALDDLRSLAGACQCIPDAINALRHAIDHPDLPAQVAILPVFSLAGWYAPHCADRTRLNAALAMFRTVSQRPRELACIYAPSSTEALLKLAQYIVRTAERCSKVCIERPAAERRRPEGDSLDAILRSWPLIRDEMSRLTIPDLEPYKVEAEWEYGKALLRWEDEGATTPTQTESMEGQMLDIEARMQQFAEAIGDDVSRRIMAITSRTDWSGERKMEELLRLDNRFAGKNSVQWGKLLGVKPDAVRGYDLWKQLQDAKKADR